MRQSEGEFTVLSFCRWYIHANLYRVGSCLAMHRGVKARKHPAQIDSLSHALRQAGRTFTSTDIVPSPPRPASLCTAWDYIRRKDLCSVRANDIDRAKFFK